MTNLYLDFHILQTVGPANINRDDTGSPKSAVFGGVRRVRVSSQSWKHAMRRDFATFLDANDLGERTLAAADRIAKAITELKPYPAEKAEELAEQILKAAGVNTKKKNNKNVTEYLVFLAKRQIQALAQLAIELAEEGKFTKGKPKPDVVTKAKAAFNVTPSIDVALFGRMITDAPDLNVDACCQVAHAISVHGAETEFDYFTAVDDNAPEDNVGAAMIGTVEFVSSTLYRYATINVKSLYETLGSQEDVTKAVEAFAKSFVTSMPTGKQNTFASRTRPEFVMLSVRSDQPVNFVEAFETAITTNTGRIAEATDKLAKHAFEADETYSSKPEKCVFLAIGGANNESTIRALEKLGKKVNLAEIISTAGDAVRNIEKGV